MLMPSAARLACSHSPETSSRGNFITLLPTIRRIARYCFRRLPGEEREEAIQEVIASAFVAHARLVQRGKDCAGFATSLARYAIAQFRAGRRVGSRLNSDDLTSAYCQLRSGHSVTSLCRQTEAGDWEELVVEDKRCTPADVAVTKLDFIAWLGQLDKTRRNAARSLASGATTKHVAEQLRLSAARISQRRRELHADWLSFQGEKVLVTTN